ncbi:MAG: lysophospholipid acyltransferase family protein [Proteobacteria bacterium]|nr:lysophospholipid acyltransferase family protein [Pseudomonadota bacterium]
MKKEALLKLAPILAGIRLYHNHSVVGEAHLPCQGPAIIAVSHSLASYDIALLMAAIYETVNRVPRSLIDRLFYKVPGLGPLMEALGSREGTYENGIKFLNEGEILVLAPGGMRESLRPSTEKYLVKWSKRFGFVKLAIDAGVPVILAACPAADDLYDIMPSHVTSWAYRTFRIPIFFARGIGLSPLPKPIRLTHYLSEPQFPPKRASDPAAYSQQVTDFHAKICARMERLIEEALELEKNRTSNDGNKLPTR